MNERTENLIRQYKPKLAIVVHESDNGETKYYLESHSIDSQGRILAGQPLKQETIQGIVDVFFDERRDSNSIAGLIPENLLKHETLPAGKYVMVWYRPEEKRNMFFISNLKIPNGVAWVPPMIYMVNGGRLSVYSVISNDRPKEETILYRAPFHNVGDLGGVCLGNAKVKKPEKKTYTNMMKYWEDLFWLSEFTSLHGNTMLVNGNINILWKQLISSKNNFPMMELIASKKTLKSLI